MIQERTKAGWAAARARSRYGGRPKVTSEEARVVLAKKLHADKSLEIDDICKTLRISRLTFYRYIRLRMRVPSFGGFLTRLTRHGFLGQSGSNFARESALGRSAPSRLAYSVRDLGRGDMSELAVRFSTLQREVRGAVPNLCGAPLTRPSW